MEPKQKKKYEKPILTKIRLDAGFAKAQHGTLGVQSYLGEYGFFVFFLFFRFHD